MNKLRRLGEHLRSSLWFIPTLLTCAAVLLAVVLVDLDSSLDLQALGDNWPRFLGVGAAGSRGMLSAIASSMITVAGVTFSITIVALALASGQYTSRILRNFIRDRANQTVLGVFVGVFAYCLVVLRTIRGGDEGGAFVPSLAVLVAVLLAFVAIGFLIFFIHHVANSIQASSIIEAAACETLEAIDRLFPAQVGQAAAPPRFDSDEDRGPADTLWNPIPSRKTGYLQGIDADALFDLAREYDSTLRMQRGIGEFIVEGAALVSIAGREPDPDAIRRVNAAFVVGPHRTIDQDAGFGIRQIVDVALKALSPGINDTTTAINSIDYLGAILARLVVRPIETERRTDRGRLLLIARGPTFDGLLAESIDQIRQNADGNVAVLIRLLETLGSVAERSDNARRRQALHRHVELVAEVAQRSVPSSHDRDRIRAARDHSLGLPDDVGTTGFP